MVSASGTNHTDIKHLIIQNSKTNTKKYCKQYFIFLWDNIKHDHQHNFKYTEGPETALDLLEIPVHRKYLYIESTCTLEIPVHWKYLYTGNTFTLEIPVHWKYLYIGNTCTLEIPVHWKYLYIGNTCTLKIPVHQKYLYIGNTCTLEIPVH